MNENVIPIRKTDRYGLFKAHVESNGEVVETDQTGFAYLKPGAKMFRLRLWMFPKDQYFLAPDDSDPKAYVILSMDEYELPNGETRTSWNRIGGGFLQGGFIRLRFLLLSEDIFLCLYPLKANAEVSNAA